MRLRVALLALLTAAPVAISAAPQSDLSRAETEERNLRDQLATISRSLKELRAELVALEEKAAALRETQETHSAELAAAEAGLASREGQVEALIRTLYKLQKSGAIQQAFAAESASDVRRQTQYLKVVLQEISRLTSAYVAEARAHREALEKVEEDRAALQTIEDETREREASLDEEQARLRGMLNQARGRRDLALRMMVEQADEDAGGGAITLDQETAIDLAGSGVELVDTSSFTSLQGQMDWPVMGDVMRGFGGYKDAMGMPATNFGLDIKAPAFAPFRAVADGRVQHVGYVDRNGLTVIVEHVGGYMTVYAHAAQVSVVAGQQIAAGDVLGTVGETGVSDDKGPRLHFEIRSNHNPINPTPWLR